MPNATKKVLIVKTSSMGDLIQLLPALTDARKAIPGIQFDWVAEESFAEIPAWHPAVNNIIHINHRRWKKHFWKHIKNGEIKQFIKTLRKTKYDLIIDAQSNLKSSLVTLFARGKKVGIPNKSAHHFCFDFVYQQKITIEKNQHHMQRMRQLLAAALNYDTPSTDPDYGIDRIKLSRTLSEVNIELPDKFVFMTHIASRDYKLWPEASWEKVIKYSVKQGFHILLPWWSEAEKARAQRLANISDKVILIPNMNLTQKAAVIANAKAAMSCDTGLAHMAAALNIPGIVFYGPTNPALVGTAGPQQIHMQATAPDCAPCCRSRCHYQGETKTFPACMASIDADKVMTKLESIIAEIS